MLFQVFIERHDLYDVGVFKKTYDCDKVESDLFDSVLCLFNSQSVTHKNKLDSFFFVKKQCNMLWHDNEVLSLRKGVSLAPYSNYLSKYLKIFQSDFIVSRSYFDIFVKLMECYSVGTVNDLLKCLQLKKSFKNQSNCCNLSTNSNSEYIMYNIQSKFHKSNDNIIKCISHNKVKRNGLHTSFLFNDGCYKTLCHKYCALFVNPTSNRFDFALAGSLANFNGVKDSKQLHSWLSVIVPRFSYMFVSAFILNPKYFVELNDILSKNNLIYCDQMFCVGQTNDKSLISKTTHLNCYGENVFFFRSGEVRWNSCTKQQFSNFGIFSVSSKDCYNMCLFQYLANIVDFIVTKNEDENAGRVYFDSNCDANDWKRPKNWNFYLLES